MKFCIPLAALLFTLILPIVTFAAELKPRAEINLRAGTERSILMTEFWAPLAQQSDRVLYGDLRLMGDDSDNREGNLGFGYRQISTKTNSVLGGNVWIDRRRTENGNNFHQLTLGVESLGDKIDLRANGYIQLNSSKTRVTPNIGSATPYLAGSGIFFDTNGFVSEEPQHGFDAEIGYRLPVLQKYIDATRIYAGGYHFFGDLSDSTTGLRLRTEAQVNSLFSIGARFQHDGPRGSQGFLEATLRFPFKSKKLYQEHGLKSRLDESPERDIDIVTGAKVDTGLMKQALNTSGTTQRVLYVDNTNINIGDGTKENPFNTLASAQAALQENDILYINRGDGTTTGMDQGIKITKAGVSLIGSGSDLTYNGFTLISATAAPVISNITAYVNDYNSNGVHVGASNVLVTGITVQEATGNGFFAGTQEIDNLDNITFTNLAAFNNRTGLAVILSDNTNLGTINIHNITVSGSNFDAVSIQANNTNSRAEQINISQVNSTGSRYAVRLTINNTSIIENVLISDVTGNIGRGNAMQVDVTNGSSLNNIEISRAQLYNSTGGGFVISANNGNVGNVSIKDTILNGNTIGISLSATNGGVIGQLNIDETISSNNTQHGIYIRPQAGSFINNATLSNVTTNNNTQYGIYMQALAGTLTNSVLSNVISNNNGRYGVALVSSADGTINGAELDNVTTNSNAQYGLHLYSAANTSTITGVKVSNSTAENNSINGVYLLKQNASAVFDIDLGGGLYNGVGQNRFFGNIGNDIRLAYTGGGTAIARNNWWGVNAAPTRVTLSGSTTLDSAGYLATDPRP